MSNKKEVSSIRKSLYGNFVLAMSDAWHDLKSLGNCLNWLQRNYDDIHDRFIEKALNEFSDDESEKRIRGLAISRIFRFALEDGFRPNTFEKMLAKKDRERLDKHDKNSRKGGIKPFRIGQILYGTANMLIDEHKDGTAIVPNSFKEDAFENILVKYAQKYHEKCELSRKKRTSDADESDEPVVQEMNNEFVEAQTSVEDILEWLENGGSASELENVEKIEQVRELASGNVKGGLTRRLKALEAA